MSYGDGYESGTEGVRGFLSDTAPSPTSPEAVISYVEAIFDKRYGAVARDLLIRMLRRVPMDAYGRVAEELAASGDWLPRPFAWRALIGKAAGKPNKAACPLCRDEIPQPVYGQNPRTGKVYDFFVNCPACGPKGSPFLGAPTTREGVMGVILDRGLVPLDGLPAPAQPVSGSAFLLVIQRIRNRGVEASHG